MPLISGGGGGTTFNGGTITQPLVIAPTSSGVVPLVVHAAPGAFAANGNVAEWYDDTTTFRGSLAARGGQELDLAIGATGFVVFPPDFQGLSVNSTGAALSLGFFGAGTATQQTLHSATATPEQIALALEANGFCGGD